MDADVPMNAYTVITNNNEATFKHVVQQTG